MKLRIKFKLLVKTPDKNWLIPLFIIGIGENFDVFLITILGIEFTLFLKPKN